MLGFLGNSAFVVSNVGLAEASVTLADTNGVVEAVSVPVGETHMFEVGLLNQLDSTTNVADSGFVITSDEPLQVYSILPPAAWPSADGTIILPSSALGTRHRAVAYNDGHRVSGSGLDDRQYLAVVATEDETDVTVTVAAPGAKTLAGPGVIALDADAGPDTVVVTLDRLQTLVIGADSVDPGTGQFSVELSGTTIESNKPVAAYSGNPASDVPRASFRTCCADILATALPPVHSWGNEYAGVKTLPLGLESDLWRLIADVDNTTVEVTGDVVQTITLNAGEYEDIETSGNLWFSSNEPVGLVHFLEGNDTVKATLTSHEGQMLSNPSDPAMVWVHPVGNWLNRYVFPVGPSTIMEWFHDHVTVVAPHDQWSTLTLNGSALPSPTDLNGEFGFVRVPVSDPIYELKAPDGVPVEITVYGYANYGSYLYPGGMGLLPLNPEL